MGILELLCGVNVGLALLVGAWIDCKCRRFPHSVALWMALSAGVGVVCRCGLECAAAHAAIAFASMVALTLFEGVWRATRGSMGIGGGDIKLLGCLVLVSPRCAFLAFILALMGLAMVGLIRRKSVLPLVPFICITFPLSIFVTSIWQDILIRIEV